MEQRAQSDLRLSGKPLLVRQRLSRDPDEMREQLFKPVWEKHSRKRECHIDRPEVGMCSSYVRKQAQHGGDVLGAQVRSEGSWGHCIFFAIFLTSCGIRCDN